MESAVNSAKDSAQSPACSRKASPLATSASCAGQLPGLAGEDERRHRGQPRLGLLERVRVGPLRLLRRGELAARTRGSTRKSRRGSSPHQVNAVGSPPMAAFRFALQASKAASPAAWRDLARKAEDLGYSTLYVPDHLDDQWAPMIAADGGGGGHDHAAGRHPGPRQRLPPPRRPGQGGRHPRRGHRRPLRVRPRRRLDDHRLRAVGHPDGHAVGARRPPGREPGDHARPVARRQRHLRAASTTA